MKPIHKIPKELLSITERLKRYLGELWNGKPKICTIHNVEYEEHGFEGQADCPECRQVALDKLMNKDEDTNSNS